ncbi:MAG: nucleotidyltransferase domain-containing protein [Cyanobacteria bacterium P01_A01_bin.37]
MTDLALLTAASTQIAEWHPALKLLILFGSRARGDHDCDSDWDIAFLREPKPENPSAWFPGADLLLTLSEHAQIPGDSRSERLRQRLELIDLSTCSDILAHFVAQEGQSIYEREPGEFERLRSAIAQGPRRTQAISPSPARQRATGIREVGSMSQFNHEATLSKLSRMVDRLDNLKRFETISLSAYLEDNESPTHFLIP